MDELRLHDTTDAKTGWAYWWVAYKTMEALTGSSPPASLGELVPRIAPRPLLLISGATGDEQAADEIWAARAGAGSSIWHAEDAGHAHALAAHPAEYERRVVGLFDRGLLHRRGGASRTSRHLGAAFRGEPASGKLERKFTPSPLAQGVPNCPP